MDLLYNIFSLNSELSPISIKIYSSNINKLLEICKINKLELLYTEPQKVKLCIDVNYTNPHSKKGKYVSLIVLLKNLPKNELIDEALKIYNEEMDEQNRIIREQLASHIKTDKQNDKWITEEENIKIKDYLKSLIPSKIQTIKDLNAYRNYIIFMLYDAMPSRLDYADTIIKYKNKNILSDEYNYILLDKKNKKVQYIMNQYKTAKTYGNKQIDINAELYDILNDYFKHLKKFNNKHYLLLDDSGNKLSRNRLSTVYKSLGEVINKPLSVSVNRHIKISNMVPIEKMKQMADNMGNSISEQVFTYAKA